MISDSRCGRKAPFRFLVASLVGLILAPLSALAGEDDLLEAVVVTARRREEPAQEVPLAITVLGAAVLERQNIQTANDLERLVPGLNIANVTGGHGYVDFAWLRGVPGVVGYFAETPVNLNGGAMYFDLENVSVLKGPQGTLFGQSTNGGALLFAPAKPSNRRGGYVQTALGNYGHTAVEMVMNAPIQEDRLLVRIGFKDSRVNGFQHDLSSGSDYGDQNERLGRVSVTLRTGGGFDNTLLVNQYQSHNNGPANVLAAVNPAGVAALVYGPALDDLLTQQQALGKGAVPGTAVPGGPVARINQTNIVNTARWQLDDFNVIRNIVGYQRTSTLDRASFVNLQLPIYDDYDADRPAVSVQKTTELQLQGSAWNHRLNYTLGSFFAWTRNQPAAGDNLGFKYVRILGQAAGTDTDKRSHTRALYGQADYILPGALDNIVLTAGLRRTWDDRSLGLLRLDGTGALTGRFYDAASWSALSHNLSVAWHAAPGAMWYFTRSKGYSSGGFNTDPNTPEAYSRFQPEFLTNHEFGVKSDWQWGSLRGRTNASVFRSYYRDIQAIVLVPAGGGAPPGSFAVVTSNAAQGHVDGLDAEVALVPYDGLEFAGNVAWLNTRYDDYILSDGSDARGRHFIYVPRLKFGLRMNCRLPLDPARGRLDLALDYTHQSPMNQNPNKANLTDTDWVPSLGTLNASLRWRQVAGGPNLEALLFVTNLLNNRVASGGLPLYDDLGVMSRAVAPPRMWGVRLRYGF